VPTLYLDMNIYKRPFDDQRQMRIRLETVAITMIFALIDDGQLSARWSFVLDYENSRDPIPECRAFVQYLSRCCETTIAPPMISLLSSFLCEDAAPYLAFPGQLSSRKCADNMRTRAPTPSSRSHLLLLAAPKRQAESASDDLLSVLTLCGPDTQYCVRPEALESFPGERLHLINGSSRNPVQCRHAHTSSRVGDSGWTWLSLFRLVMA